ncbi:MAG: hypothetical protein IMX00_06125 [Limnochordales bacterium]|nr:hypothetical protein [Limnochordales bacterium]
MEKGEKLWAAVLGTLVISAYAVPYLFLRHVHAWYGAGLFWTLFALAVILLLALFTSSWQDKEEE